MLAVRACRWGWPAPTSQQHRHFIAAAEEYRRDIQRVMNGDIAANQKKGEVYLAGRELWEQRAGLRVRRAVHGVGARATSDGARPCLRLWLVVSMHASMLRSDADGSGRLMFARILRHEWRALRADATIWVDRRGLRRRHRLWRVERRPLGRRSSAHALADARGEERERYARLHDPGRRAGDRPGAQISPFADPRSPANVGGRLGPRYAALPPAPLAALAIGQSDLLPYYFKVSTDARENIVAATSWRIHTGCWPAASTSRSCSSTCIRC